MITKLPADADILPPSDDHIFKTLLTHPDAKRVLMSVVSTTIDRKVTDVEVRNNELPAMSVDDKNERLDVNCIVDGGDQVDVEMQCSQVEEDTRDNHRSFINKSIFYLTDLHSSQKSKGLKYRDFVRTYQVTFCGYTVFPDLSDFVTRASLRRDTGGQISDQINMVIVEMNKLESRLTVPVKNMSWLESWSIFFNFADNPAHRDLINNIINEKEEINMASELLMQISQDDRERARLRSRRMAETDRISNLLTARDNGIAEGIAIGEARGEAKSRMEIALSMKSNGMSVEIIAQLTKLPVREIERL